MEQVLLVDDDALSRFGVRDFLEQRGFEVREAATGREALALFEQTRSGVVITDLVMPEMDGIELTRAIRERGEAKVIWCTAHDRDAFREEARRLGVDGYLVKPLDLELLLEAIASPRGAMR
jgi:CheY-like chemotaxis protein